MIRSKIAMGFLWTALALVLHLWSGVVAPVHGQGTRKDDIVFNSRGVPLAGAFVIGVLADGMVMLGISEFWQMVIKGIVIVLAVAVDQLQTKLQLRLARSH